MSMRGGLWVEEGGSGAPTLLLLHGLGGNAAVWDNLRPIIDQRWRRGRWLAPDLLGHGRSPHAPPYSIGGHAAAVAALVEPGTKVVVLGHSMGGAVAMALASGWFGAEVAHVIAFGVKLVWQAEEIAKARALAQAPARRFATRAEAVERYLRVAGLGGLIDPEGAVAQSGVVTDGNEFRLAADPRISEVVGAPIDKIIAAMRAPLRLAAGARDAMVGLEQMRRFDPAAQLIDNAGHNPHVEMPERLWSMVEDALGKR
jgi:pimeloyl-ACP methyl ester carboxylesterase